MNKVLLNERTSVYLEYRTQSHSHQALAPQVGAQNATISSYRASVRKMQALLSAPVVLPVQKTPTQRFIETHPLSQINAVLSRYGMTSDDLALFKQMIAEEKPGFIGYHAGSSTVRFFHDLIRMVVQDVLEIPVKEDFVFTRVPGDPTFRYEQASDFLRDKGRDLAGPNGDTTEDLRQHILSMNMNLYQWYNQPWDLTPRYYLENTTWTYANVKKLIEPLFASLGIDAKALDSLWNEGIDLLPHDRGYILQYFDSSPGYAFTKEHSYIAGSGGRPHAYLDHQVLFNEKISNFPQMRMVMGNQSTLNPFSSLSIKRYDQMTDGERQTYETKLRALVKKLSYDPEKIATLRKNLLALWGQV